MRTPRQPEHPIRPGEGPSGAPGLARLCLGAMLLPDEAVAALFPDFAIERMRPERAAAQDLPFVSLGEGLLRAPRRGRGAGQCLSATASVMSGPSSPADCLDPVRILADRGWETSALLARAAAARQSLLDARVGGAWWE